MKDNISLYGGPSVNILHWGKGQNTNIIQSYSPRPESSFAISSRRLHLQYPETGYILVPP